MVRVRIQFGCGIRLGLGLWVSTRLKSELAISTPNFPTSNNRAVGQTKSAKAFRST